MPQIIDISPTAALFISDQTKPLTSSWFDPEFWRLEKAPVGTGKTLLGTGTGRGEVWFINSLFGQFVIRRYRRGGLVGKFNKSSFIFTGQEKTRPWLELSLLEQMNALGLPVPEPIAGSYSIKKGFYQAVLLTKTIKNAEDLFDIIKSIKRDQVPWQEIGQVIKRFHDNGIYHSDLNCHNIMIDNQNKIWVIDFDKCEQRKPASKWMQSNINRLKRSLDKESKNHANFHVSNKQWQAFLEGYNG